MKTMAEVLAEHWSASTHTESEPSFDKCDGCGAVLRVWGDDSDMPGQLAAHQADALAAAGYGPVREAAAEALRDAAKELATLMYVRPGCEGRGQYEAMLAIRRGHTDTWLRDRAKAIEATS